jgi:hypothetical protein
MKKDDFVTKDIEADIVALGYDGILPVEVRLVSEWLNSKFPNSTLREGYRLWREDLLKEAHIKYPFDDQHYDRRNYIIRLAIDEILKNIPEGNKVEKNNIKNTLDLIQGFERANNLKQNTKDVLDADLKAIKIYLGLGYSINDARKAFYKVFGDMSDANKKRYEILNKYIEDYDKTNNK